MHITFQNNLMLGIFNTASGQVKYLARVNSDHAIFTQHIIVPFDFWFHGGTDDSEHFLIIPDMLKIPSPNWDKQIYFHEQLIDCEPGVANLYVFRFRQLSADMYLACSLSVQDLEIVNSAFSIV